MIRTFVDTGVLIAALRGTGEMQVRAASVLTDSARTFASSPFVRLELLPKPLYFQRAEEAAFYREFFRHVSVWARVNDDLLIAAYREAITTGAAAVDALHVAAAKQVEADEFVTAESPTKPIFRTTNLSVVSIQPLRS